jgi:hypothetical protein
LPQDNQLILLLFWRRLESVAAQQREQVAAQEEIETQEAQQFLQGAGQLIASR